MKAALRLIRVKTRRRGKGGERGGGVYGEVKLCCNVSVMVSRDIIDKFSYNLSLAKTKKANINVLYNLK